MGLINYNKNTLGRDIFKVKYLMGNESNGLNTNWLKASHQNLIIPMSKDVDSLNLSVSAGILMYEAKAKKIERQKQKNL